LIICLTTFGIAALTGMQYRLGTKLLQGNIATIAASSYGADLAGSAFGVFFIAVFVYPLIGLMYTGLLLAGINFIVVVRLRYKGL
jgi:cytochrome b561